MAYTLLAGGYRQTITTLTFDSTNKSKSIEVVAESPTPANPSWLEVAGDKVYAVSETDEDGKAVLLDLTKKDGDVTLEVKREEVTGDAPCHILVDLPRVFFANYMSGTLSTHAADLERIHTLKLPYAYEGTTPPNAKRQDGSHAHHAVLTARGLLVADLGSDRVYVLDREGKEVVDYIQCEAGFGPRHLCVSHDGTTLYILGELGHAVQAFPLSATSTTPPIPNSRASILPDIPIEYTQFMDSAEICTPCKGTVFASNRLQKHIGTMLPDLPPIKPAAGDAVAIVLYNKDNEVESVRHVQTTLCCIRAMRLSPDGTYVALAGQCDGGVEVYELGGERKEVWTLVGRNEAVKKVTDFAWL